MIQYYLDLEKQVKDLKDARLEFGQIQKIYSTAFFLSFSIRTPGKTKYLYLGRGGGQEGLWLHDGPPPSELRRKDNFLEYLRRHLSSCSFLGLELDRSDRIVKLDYQKFGNIQSLLFFWKARKLYFIHYYQDLPEAPFKLLLSWRGKAVVASPDIQDLFTYFDEMGRRVDMNHDLRSPHLMDMGQLLEEEKKAATLKGMVSSPGFLQRKIVNIEGDLERARQWSRMQEMLDKDESLEGYEIKVGDHKIKFEGELNAFERRNLLYQKIKKLKKGEEILSGRLSSAKEMLAGKETSPSPVSTLPITKPVWGLEEKSGTVQSEKKQAQEYRIMEFNQCTIGVGTSSQGNDQLRSKWAGKEDLWLHLDGLKSAHVIIKMKTPGTADTETLNLAASILAHFSHFTGDWIPVIYTAVKNLKGVTGAPGMVIYKKEKHLRCPKVALDAWFKEET